MKSFVARALAVVLIALPGLALALDLPATGTGRLYPGVTLDLALPATKATTPDAAMRARAWYLFRTAMAITDQASLPARALAPAMTWALGAPEAAGENTIFGPLAHAQETTVEGQPATVFVRPDGKGGAAFGFASGFDFTTRSRGGVTWTASPQHDGSLAIMRSGSGRGGKGRPVRVWTFRNEPGGLRVIHDRLRLPGKR